MKYANLIHNGLARGKKKRVVNIGDSFEILAIDKIYEELGIHEIINIDLYNLESYDGEEVLLPINFMLPPNMMGVNMFNISPKITPVFLGLSLADVTLNSHQLEYLKKHEPIGCRDDRTRNYLRQHSIIAYTGGCIALTHETTDEKCSNSKPLFIDVPKAVEAHVPEELLNNHVELEHEMYLEYDELLNDPSLKIFAKKRLEYYDHSINLIVTSRFHGAVIGLALGIPVILVAENNFYKFSWLSKLLPFYETEDGVPNINWNPMTVDVTYIKILQKKLAQKRILNPRKIYDEMSEIDALLTNENANVNSGLHYIGGAKEFIRSKWSISENIEYSIWGVNENAYLLYKWISDNYISAKLKHIYDGLRKTVFCGKTSKVPSRETIDNSFVFVVSNTAKNDAISLFKEIGKKNYYVCKLEFIKE